jgi:hypothetical protein
MRCGHGGTRVVSERRSRTRRPGTNKPVYSKISDGGRIHALSTPLLLLANQDMTCDYRATCFSREYARF